MMRLLTCFASCLMICASVTANAADKIPAGSRIVSEDGMNHTVLQAPHWIINREELDNLGIMFQEYETCAQFLTECQAQVLGTEPKPTFWQGRTGRVIIFVAGGAVGIATVYGLSR